MTLEIQRYLLNGGTPETLQEEYGIRHRRHGKYPNLIQFKYNQIDSPMGETIATVEHIRPRSRGGTHKLRNLALACYNCNNEKGRNADHSAPDEYFDALLEQRLEQWCEPEL